MDQDNPTIAEMVAGAPDPDPTCHCGQDDEWHTNEAHQIEEQVGYEAVADFERAHDFEYTS